MSNKTKNTLLAALAAGVGAGCIAFLTLPAATAFTATGAVAVAYGFARGFAAFLAAKFGVEFAVDKESA